MSNKKGGGVRMLSSNTELRDVETGSIYRFSGITCRNDYTFWWSFRSGTHEVSFSMPALGHNEYRERFLRRGYEVVD